MTLIIQRARVNYSKTATIRIGFHALTTIIFPTEKIVLMNISKREMHVIGALGQKSDHSKEQDLVGSLGFHWRLSVVSDLQPAVRVRLLTPGGCNTYRRSC